MEQETINGEQLAQLEKLFDAWDGGFIQTDEDYRKLSEYLDGDEELK